MALTTTDLKKTFGSKTVLECISCRFPVGLTLLTGPSGSGKSTLLRILATADSPTAGAISWNDQTLPRARGKLRKTLGYAPQAVDLPEDLTGREFGLHIAALKGLNLAKADKQFLSLAQTLGLFSDIGNRIVSYSGGMRRRLIVAQSLLGDPQLLMMDEPTAELDRENAAAIHTLVLERARHATVILTTHHADELTPHAALSLRVADGAATPV